MCAHILDNVRSVCVRWECSKVCSAPFPDGAVPIRSWLGSRPNPNKNVGAVEALNLTPGLELCVSHCQPRSSSALVNRAALGLAAPLPQLR